MRSSIVAISSRILLRGVPAKTRIVETPFNEQQHGPIGLAGFGECAADDVVQLRGGWRLWDRAAPALKLPDHFAGNLGECGGRGSRHDLALAASSNWR